MIHQPPTPEKTRMNPVRLIAMLLVVIIAGGLLTYLKRTADSEKAQLAAELEATKNQRAEAQRLIGRTILKQYGGVSKNAKDLALVARVGKLLQTKSRVEKSPVPISFTLLAEPNRINLYALPTGEIFLTTALLNRLKTEGELAAVLAHGAAHTMLAHELRSIPTTSKEGIWDFSLQQERKADADAIALMAQAGYSPAAYITLFRVLSEAHDAGAEVEFFTTHPNEPSRLNYASDTIKALYPAGVPKELSE